MDFLFIIDLLASSLRLATPLIFCALAGVLSERAGVIDIGLEGKMLFAAFAAATVGVVTKSWPLAVLAAITVACLLSALHGFACVTYQGNQVISGLAINIIAAGLTVVLGIAWFKQGGQTPQVPDAVRFKEMFDVPLLGQNALVYVALVLVFVVWWLLFRTRFGLRLRAVGENPAMVDAAGVSVAGTRYLALMGNGALCGLAGCYLVLAQNAAFAPHMTAGRGFMALAAMIFGKWHPVGALWACLLFGFLDALAIRLQGTKLPGIGEIPVQFIQALPYLMTVILLAGFIGKAVAPRALGSPYIKSR
ncbi:ABC transporter permease [Variovorax sp. PCZ-1]|uniref:ABC transporter permease n=1 Tax=Variovorax sp. PCZ-1 TaxID=2835533 RepID=UPI001BCE893C|nr:ABC transporter permease [Variovorax sp. PCZ-1]MBS7807533.1 ABC transporter permease [Variovorax sp. PCZ-1]